MINGLDIVVALIVLLCVYRGLSKGPWMTVVRIFGTWVALGVAWLFRPTMKDWLSSNTGIMNAIQDKIIKPFTEVVTAHMLGGGSEGYGEALNKMQLPQGMKDQLIEQLLKGVDFGSLVTGMILDLLSFAILFTVCLLLIQIFAIILETATKLPGLKTLNKGAGIIIGLLEGLFMIWAVFAIMTPWLALNPEGFWAQAFNKSLIAGWLYQHNMLLWVLKKYLL